VAAARGGKPPAHADAAVLPGDLTGLPQAEERLAARSAYRFSEGRTRRTVPPVPASRTSPIRSPSRNILAQWRLDSQALTPALLHDVMETRRSPRTSSRASFGAPVAELVDGVAKLDKIEFGSHEEARPRTSARCCSRWRATCASS